MQEYSLGTAITNAACLRLWQYFENVTCIDEDLLVLAGIDDYVSNMKVQVIKAGQAFPSWLSSCPDLLLHWAVIMHALYFQITDVTHNTTPGTNIIAEQCCDTTTYRLTKSIYRDGVGVLSSEGIN